MSNRAQRRAVARGNRNLINSMTKEAKTAALLRNGITVKDLEDNHRIGFEEGFSQAVKVTTGLTYAAIGIALHDIYKSDSEDIMRVLREVDRHVCNDISSLDAAEELLRKTGIQLDFDDPIERVQEVEK